MLQQRGVTMSDSHSGVAERDALPGPDRRRRSPGAELLRRLATALVALPVVLWLLALGGHAFAALAGAAAAIAAFEYYRIVAVPMLSAAPGIAWALALPFLPPALGERAPAAAFWMIVALTGASWALALLGGDVRGAPKRVAHIIAGALFAAVGPFALSVLRDGPSGHGWALLVIVASFANDAAAYGVGRLVGRRRMAPRISPGKTWEGFAGGAIASAATVIVARATFLSTLTVTSGLAVAAICATVGPLGDLSKSMLKRARGVKDSGRLLPGHGGMLDRIDALSWNGAAVVAYLALTS
jgi:phosphatidate cytidylyltransferase